jgi:hypothetical protein
MDASDLAALCSDLPAEVRHRCKSKSKSKPTNRERQAMTTIVLAEIGLGEVKVGRALYTLRRRIAARARHDRIAAAAAIK